ncbi:hypothetical protein XI06_35715 [Bradyrhizobium sp. CCBAU 11434]|nr:hypothetical protein [Bradyrhizobium sp. CCBAU 11434]
MSGEHGSGAADAEASAAFAHFQSFAGAEVARFCAIAAHRVLRRADAPWGYAPDDPAVERLASPMVAANASR